MSKLTLSHVKAMHAGMSSGPDTVARQKAFADKLEEELQLAIQTGSTCLFIEHVPGEGLKLQRVPLSDVILSQEERDKAQCSLLDTFFNQGEE